MAYIRGEGATGPKQGCIFCFGEEESRDPERLVLGLYPRTAALCNKFPYNNGHVLVAPRRHVAEPWALSKEERAELAALVCFATRAIAQEYSPEGFNIGVNLGKPAGAGVPYHLHVHIVPRWGGDTNFMTSVSETRVLPESLADTHARLRARFREFVP